MRRDSIILIPATFSRSNIKIIFSHVQDCCMILDTISLILKLKATNMTDTNLNAINNIMKEKYIELHRVIMK